MSSLDHLVLSIRREDHVIHAAMILLVFAAMLPALHQFMDPWQQVRWLVETIGASASAKAAGMIGEMMTFPVSP